MTPGKGDLCAWRRVQGGQRVAEGFAVVEAVEDGVVTVAPLTGSPSHHLRRPPADVRVLVSHAQCVAWLAVELERCPW
ncbi:MAG: hypothetical protein GEV08_06210 [Acidimicrobiia bacterium]|nr:hypothetical protein [Acidimicrobiia bacterium]